MIEAGNLSFAWAKLIITELRKLNITDFVIAPGSRSAPLTIACAEDPKLSKHLHLDERGVGFFALGLAKAKKKPVAIIVTSGTAVANLYPAIIESYMTNVPLLVLSADRPLDLYDSSANQTIIQQDIFNKYAPCIQLLEPNFRYSIKNLLTKIDHAVYKLIEQQKPLQINCPLFKPLYPCEKTDLPKAWLQEFQQALEAPYPQEQIYGQKVYLQDRTLLENIFKILSSPKSKILLIIGSNVNHKYYELIESLSLKLKIITIADLQASYPYECLACHDLWLETTEFKNFCADLSLIIQVGERLISSSLLRFKQNFKALQITLSDYSYEIDPNYNSSYQLIGIEQFFNFLMEQTLNYKERDLSVEGEIKKLVQQNQQFLANFERELKKDSSFNELSVSYELAHTQDLPIFIGNSLCCRYCDLMKWQHHPTIFTNRGASGIDGIIATACGISAYYGFCTLVIGDISALHDLSSFMLLKKYPVQVFIFNNKGGNIFALLKDHEENPYLDEYFELSHDLNFEQIAQMFDLKYKSIKTIKELNLILSDNSLRSVASIIECNFIKDQSIDVLKTIKQKLLSL